MYNAYKFKKDKFHEKQEASKVKPLYEVDPVKAARKTKRLAENAKSRRQQWIDKVNIEDSSFNGKFYFYLFRMNFSNLRQFKFSV